MNLEEAIALLGGKLEATGEEKKNGWTDDTLTIYHAERAEVSRDNILHPKTPKPTKQKGALKWR